MLGFRGFGARRIFLGIKRTFLGLVGKGCRLTTGVAASGFSAEAATSDTSMTRGWAGTIGSLCVIPFPIIQTCSSKTNTVSSLNRRVGFSSPVRFSNNNRGVEPNQVNKPRSRRSQTVSRRLDKCMELFGPNRNKTNILMYQRAWGRYFGAGYGRQCRSLPKKSKENLHSVRARPDQSIWNGFGPRSGPKGEMQGCISSIRDQPS